MSFDVKAELMTLWDGHRRLTVRTAQAFPADKLMAFSPTQPLRPFALMCDEVARMELAYIRGLAEDEWRWDPQAPAPATDAAGVVRFLEETRAYTHRVWDRIGVETLLAVRKDPFFFGDSMRPYDWLLYCVDNEVHHRGQGYVYLRQLGIEPPHFWER
jgi:uncharacterized damage-inducible protein DinB